MGEAEITASLAERVVRYADLQPCYNAFVDSRTPGSDAKENFCIVGPGVAENPAQHVHIAEPHGFNIGGARQPPHCTNSQHSHETAEVFVVHSGYWRFDFGEDGRDAQVLAAPGDVVSLPVHAFRGFTNVGDTTGFLWSVLGGDDPGRVLWAPKVFDLAAEHGLILLDDGRLVDTVAGETVPAGATPMPRTTPADVARLRWVRPSAVEAMVFRGASDHAAGERPVIGPDGPLYADGFELSRLIFADGAATKDRAGAAEVLFVHAGSVTLEGRDENIVLDAGDTLSLPAGEPYRLMSVGAAMFVVRRA